MKYNSHHHLVGRHAFMSPSGSTWLRYTPDQMRNRYINEQNKARGTKLHEMASDLIKAKIKARDVKQAFNMFVNDAIGFGMESELVLYYSDNCFGTADAIRYDEESGLLRIHDLKTGTGKVKFDQLLVYSALFCLEYGMKPQKMEFILRLYQGRDFTEYIPEPKEIQEVMNSIVEMDKVLTEARIDMENQRFW